MWNSTESDRTLLYPRNQLRTKQSKFSLDNRGFPSSPRDLDPWKAFNSSESSLSTKLNVSSSTPALDLKLGSPNTVVALKRNQEFCFTYLGQLPEVYVFFAFVWLQQQLD